MLNRKSKMVSFRLSADEYRLYHSACQAHGFNNISDLVRKAVNQLTSSGNGGSGSTLDDQLREVRARLTHLEGEVEKWRVASGNGGEAVVSDGEVASGGWRVASGK